MKWNNFYICELPCEVYDQNKIRRVERSHVTSIKFFFFFTLKKQELKYGTLSLSFLI